MIKQVIVMRKDLNMRKGKMCAQAAHAAMKFILDEFSIEKDPVRFNEKWHRAEGGVTTEEKEWIEGVFTKICVSVNSEEELLEIMKQADQASLTVHLIEDNGLTEFGGIKTKTCLAIGPNVAEEIDKITGHLPLL